MTLDKQFTKNTLRVLYRIEMCNMPNVQEFNKHAKVSERRKHYSHWGIAVLQHMIYTVVEYYIKANAHYKLPTLGYNEFSSRETSFSMQFVI